MELLEYGEILATLIPTGGRYIAMDNKLIMVFDSRPKLVQTSNKTWTWRGGNCLGWTKYWNDFIDTSALKDDDGVIDWNLAFEPMPYQPWKNPLTLQQWAELLDHVLPYDSAFATTNHQKLEMWTHMPFYKKGEWAENGGRLPRAAFYLPKGYIIAKDVDEYQFYF